jgi:hypothetical protein
LVFNYDKESLGSQACLVRNSRLETRYYVRLEGYSFFLLDNEKNILATLLLDLEDGQKTLFKMSNEGIDILKVVAEDLKIDYEQVSGNWSIELDKEQL